MLHGWLTFLTDFLLFYQLGTYENDFKMERDEKINALREKDRAVQTYEQLRKEHFSLRQNIERMYSQAHAQQQVHANHSFVRSFYLFLCGYLECYSAKKYIEDITCPLVDMNFIFEWSTRYRVEHEKIEFISTSEYINSSEIPNQLAFKDAICYVTITTVISSRVKI